MNKISKQLYRIAKQINSEQDFNSKLYKEFDQLYNYSNNKYQKMSKIKNQLFDIISKKKTELEKEKNNSIQDIVKIHNLEYEINKFNELYKHFEWIFQNINDALNSLNQIKIYE